LICQFCKKNIATVHLTELVHGTKQEVHLCEACARKKGLSTKPHFTIQDLLSSLMEQEKENVPPGLLSLKCPSCGLTFSQFRKSGRFGCPHDYQVFKDGLAPLLDRIHGSSKHVGKMPRRVNSDTAKERALLDLRSQLEESIHHEEYERAAELRDRIRVLEGSSEKPPVHRKEAKRPRKKRQPSKGGASSTREKNKLLGTEPVSGEEEDAG
jgi:protein arginine kinase activator